MTSCRNARIVSDGTPNGTTVEVDGQPLGLVTAVTWTCAVDQLATATVTLVGVPVEVETMPDRIVIDSDQPDETNPTTRHVE